MTPKVYKSTAYYTLFRDIDGRNKLVRNGDNFACTLDLSEAADMMDMSNYQFEHCARTYIQNVEAERNKHGYPLVLTRG